jgi:hypothetical protein
MSMKFCQSQAFPCSYLAASGGINIKYYMNIVNNSMKLQINSKLYFYFHQSILLGPPFQTLKSVVTKSI